MKNRHYHRQNVAIIIIIIIIIMIIFIIIVIIIIIIISSSSSSSSSSSLLWSPSEGVRCRGTGPQKFIFWEFSCNPVTNNFLFMLLVLLPPVYSSGKFVIRGGPVPWYQTSSSLLMRVRYHGTGPPFMSLPWGIKCWEKKQNHFQNINRHSADKKRREIHFF